MLLYLAGLSSLYCGEVSLSFPGKWPNGKAEVNSCKIQDYLRGGDRFINTIRSLTHKLEYNVLCASLGSVRDV